MTGQPHDALFRATFSNLSTARSVLRAILPRQVSQIIDWSTLRLESGQFTTEGLRSRFTDLLFSVALKDGSDLRLLLLFEHQSGVDRWMPLRSLEYAIGGWRLHLRKHPDAKHIPPVLPVVLHHGPGGWTASLEFQDLFGLSEQARAVLGPYLPSFRLWVEELGRRETEELVRLRASAEVRMVLFCLKRVRDGEVFFDELPGFRAICAELEQTAAGRQALRRILSYIQQVTDVPEGHVVHKILEALGPEAKEEFVTLAEKLEQKGLVRGMQQGMQKGMQQGERRGQQRLLVKQLTLKFGALDAEATARLEAATLAQLSLFSERVLSAGSLAEVFED